MRRFGRFTPFWRSSSARRTGKFESVPTRGVVANSEEKKWNAMFFLAAKRRKNTAHDGSHGEWFEISAEPRKGAKEKLRHPLRARGHTFSRQTLAVLSR